ncbi:MAG: ATP-binding SpoIIE family protein phosphatase [Bacteroidota bacterium]
MDNDPHIRHSLPDRSYSSGIKREIHRLAESLGLSKLRLGETDIIVSEMVSNLNKHASDGELLVKAFQDLHGRTGLELISIDHGPGIENLDEMLKDGNSSTNTLGQGLGAIKRLSDEFDIYSITGWGTILLSRIFAHNPIQEKRMLRLAINTIMLPKKGERVCGDGWKIIRRGFEYDLIALDGLGHGTEANKAAKAAIDEFSVIKNATPADTIKILHRKIQKTRGAVGMVMHLNTLNNLFSYAGLGNISARIFGHEKNKTCISYNGIIGHTIPNSLHTNQVGIQKNETLIVNSDGFKSRWDVAHLPNILNHDGSIVAAALYKDFSRKTDDLLVIVVKLI